VDDLEGLLERLIQHDVAFVVVGGLAAAAQGVTLVTHDVDICCPLDDETLARLARALDGLHPVHRMTPTRIPFDPAAGSSRGLKNLYLATDIGQLDCLSSVKGIGGFDDALAESVEIDFGPGRCRILSVSGLIRAKTAMGLPRDRQAIAQLQAIRDHAEGTGSDPPPP
jgi:hypothetical protein